MTENEARALIGRQWDNEVAEMDWAGWYPVLTTDGRIEDVCPADMSIDEAADEGWVFSSDDELYRINWPLADVLAVVWRYGEGASSGDDRYAVAIAQEWVDAGFDAADVRRWLDACVCFADHAQRLKAAGFDPDNLPDWVGPGWLTDEELADILDPEEAAEDEEEAP